MPRRPSMANFLLLELPALALAALVAWAFAASALPLGPLGAPFHHRPYYPGHWAYLAVSGLAYYLLCLAVVSHFLAHWSPGGRAALALGAEVLLLGALIAVGLTGNGSSYFALKVAGPGLLAHAPGAGTMWAAGRAGKWIRRHHAIAHLDDPDATRRGIAADLLSSMTRRDSGNFVRFPTAGLARSLLPHLDSPDEQVHQAARSTFRHWLYDVHSGEIETLLIARLSSPGAEARLEAADLLRAMGPSPRAEAAIEAARLPALDRR